jgi:hypothetical protein
MCTYFHTANLVHVRAHFRGVRVRAQASGPGGGSRPRDNSASLAHRRRSCRRWPGARTPCVTQLVSPWLIAGVPPPEVAERAGHSVDVLLKVYATCIDGQEATVNAD